MIKVPNGGELLLLELIRSSFNDGNHRVRLFVNNITPGDTDTAGTYTEASFPGYAAINAASWGAAATNGSGDAEIDETNRTWTCTGGGSTQSVYGYYVTDNSGALVYAELDPRGPSVMFNNGDNYSVLPKFTLRSRP